MESTQRQLLKNFIYNKIKSGIYKDGELKLIESKLFFFNKCIAFRKFNDNGYEELFINIYKYDNKTLAIQNYLLNNSFKYNRTVIIINNDIEFNNFLSNE